MTTKIYDKGMVIVGAGEAGTRAAIELRNQGWGGLITLIGEENMIPYERPPLSKNTLLSEDEPSPNYIAVKKTFLEYDINFVSNYKVTEINRDNKTVILDNADEIPYERLLLATGARPRKLPSEISNNSRLMYLRTFSDSLSLRNKLVTGKHVVVIGGGFIGLEVATSAIKRGCTVTVIEVGPRILMRGVPEEVAKIIEERHINAGVQFKYGQAITNIETEKVNHVINLADGSKVVCDEVIVGIGAVPETSLAESSGLDVDNGISVNEKLETSDPNIYAIGDCCSFPHRYYGGDRIRLEAWRNAQDQGTHVARNMLGASEPYVTIPWFWSDQYDQTLYVAGLSGYGKNVVCRDLGDSGKIFFHLSDDNEIVAASGVGTKVAKDIRTAELFIEKRVKVNPNDLTNADIKLKKLLTVNVD